MRCLSNKWLPEDLLVKVVLGRDLDVVGGDQLLRRSWSRATKHIQLREVTKKNMGSLLSINISAQSVPTSNPWAKSCLKSR